MTSTTNFSNFEKNLPLVGNIKRKNPFAYQITQGIIKVSNAFQMALAEAYITGLEVPDSAVKGLLDIFLPIAYKRFPALLVPYEWVLEESEKLAEDSEELMKIQYDLPEEMFSLMLEEDELLYPKYTMALWEKGASNLKQAQMDMLEDAIEKAGIQDGDEILDLGCGWGSASHYILSKFPNAKVTALNLSHEQCEYMRKKMQDPKSCLNSERFTLMEQNFNDAVFDKKFDRIVAIGLCEHIGNLTKSFQKLASFLKDNGRVFIHIISIRLPHNCWSAYLNRYIFPRARVWQYDAIPKCNQSLKTINKWYLNGCNYSQTLNRWLQNFDNNQSRIKELDYGINYAKFRRIWRLYLMWCMAYFDACDGEVLGNGQYLMVHAK